MKKLVINGQAADADTVEGLAYITIREPFYSAGKQLAWPEQHSTAGLSINKDLVNYCNSKGLTFMLTVAENKNKYCITPYEIIRFCRMNKSYWTAEGVELYTFPFSLTQPVRWAASS